MSAPTPEQIAFGAFIRTAAHAAALHGRDLEAAQMIAWNAEAGHSTRPRTIAKLAGLLGLTIDEVLGRAPQPSSDLERLVNRGLARAGLTMRDVERQIGINAQQVQQWISGQRRPTIANLEALTALLDEPNLKTLLSPYAPVGKVTAACTSCGKERLVWPNRGNERCRDCASYQTGQLRIERIRKRSGRAGLHQLGQELHRHQKIWREEHPKEAAEVIAKLQNGARAYIKTPHDSARQGLGNLTLTPPGRFGLCRLCGLLTFFEHTEIARPESPGRSRYGLFHGACSVRWSRSTEMRTWASQCRRKPTGSAAPPMPLPDRPARRTSSPEELAEAYATTVRYFRQKTGSKRADRDEHRQVRPVSWLAQDLGLTPRALQYRVQRFLELLPNETVASGRMKTWRSIFLLLNIDKLRAPQNVSQVAQPESENASQVAHPSPLPTTG